jgi:anti-sigma regulatory factor (Ser/Thr protein kinase)
VKSVILPGTLESLDGMADFLREASQEAGLDPKAAYRLQLAVDEVVTNIIVHGYQEAGLQGNVDLRADIDPDNLVITVEDTAVEYDPTKRAPPANLDAPLEERDMGGLGVYLALQSVDQFTYERVNNKNRNRFVIRRPGAGAAPR